MISCVIIDDEKPARETLKLMIERYLSDKIEVVETAGSLKKGVLAI
jgi:YesN/AraC family two-component response regulator